MTIYSNQVIRAPYINAEIFYNKFFSLQKLKPS